MPEPINSQKKPVVMPTLVVKPKLEPGDKTPAEVAKREVGKRIADWFGSDSATVSANNALLDLIEKAGK